MNFVRLGSLVTVNNRQAQKHLLNAVGLQVENTFSQNLKNVN